MKSKILTIIMVMLLASVCFAAGGTYPIRHRNVANPKLLTRLLQNRIGTLDDEVTALEASQSGIFSNIGTGSVFYVDTGAAASGAGTTWATAFDTLQEGIDACTDLRGDVVYVAPDYDEDITAASALDADCPGMYIIGVGSGESQPTISLITNAGADMTISAADVMVYNMRILGAYTNGVTAGMVITADGDGARVIGCDFWETSNTMEQLKCITIAAGADELVIVGNRFIGTDSADPTNAIYLTGASNKTVIQGNHFIGTWSGPVIDATTALATGLMITDNIIINLDATAGKTIQVHSSTGGGIISNKCYANGAGFAIVGDAMFVSPDNIAMNTEDVETRNFETMFGPYRGDAAGTAGDSVFADFVLIDALLDLIIADFTDYDLDKLSSAADGTGIFPASVTDDSVLAMIMTMGDGGAANISDYDFDTMSLEALNVDLDAILLGTGTTLPASLVTINDAIVAMSDTGYVGACTTNSTQTTAIVPLLAGFGDDYFNTGWSMICILRYTSAGTAPEGEIIDITNYVSSSGTFTVSENFTVALTDNDRVMVRRTEELELDMPTTLGSAGTIRYVDSLAAGDATGLTWENAHLTIQAAEDDCAAGDGVYIADGHDEEIGDVLIDVANVSFIGMGEGDAQPLLTSNDSTDEITLSAAGITVKNVRMQAGADKCTYAIRVEAAGIGCTIENVSFITAEGGNEEFEICVDVDTSAAKLTIKGCTYSNASATAADVDSFVDLTEATIDETSIIGCTVYGAFAVAPINWGAAVPTNLLLQDNVLTNITASAYGIYGTGNATGTMINNLVCTDAIGTSYDPGRLSDFGNYWDDFNVYDTAAVLWTTNEAGVNRWSATELAQIEGEATDAIEADLLNFLYSAADGGTNAYPDSVATHSALAYIMSDDANPAAAHYDNTTMSLEALNIDLDAILADTGTAGVVLGADSITSAKIGDAAISDEHFAVDVGIRRVTVGNWNFGDDTGAQNPYTVFTITGDIMGQCFGVCDDALTSGGGATIELGVSGNTAVLIVQSTATDLILNEIWHDATPTTTVEAVDMTAHEFIITGGQDAIFTIGTADLTAGDIDFYLFWTPLSSDAAVVAP